MCTHVFTASIFLGKGVPDELMTGNNQCVPIRESYVPSTVQAVQMYEQRGGSLTQWPKFGNDPLEGNMDLMSQRLHQFHHHFPSLNSIFHDAVNNNETPFCNALTAFCEITYQLAP